MTAVQDMQKTKTFQLTIPKILRRLLGLLAVLVMFISTIPVVLIFITTSVPLVVALALTAINLGILGSFFYFERSAGLLAGAALGFVLVSSLAVFASQHFASTPPITDASGEVIPGSIATLETVELNGSEQWMTIRGHSDDLPVLLFLSGGPGGSELAMTRRYLSELEKHFIIVNWDQPGVGKSYNAVPEDELTPERFVKDGIALTRHLRERFDQDKIYVLGESWGSVLGIWMVQRHPEYYHAFISTGQMIDFVENDIEMYEFALDLAEEKGDTDLVQRLRENGPPPYERGDIAMRFQAMNGIVNDYMHRHAHGEGTGHNLMFDSLAADEYGLLDRVYWGLSLLNHFPHVYSQLNEVDLRQDATEIDVPMYFIRGRWDHNSSHRLTEEYVELVDAPHAELIWFEDSAHTPLWDEPTRFVDVLVNRVLAETYPANR